MREACTVGDRTKDNLSLLYALGYFHERINDDTVRIMRNVPNSGFIKKVDLGVVQRKKVFEWLSERQDITYIRNFWTVCHHDRNFQF